MICYFLARITIHDREGYERYLAGTDPLLERFGAAVLAVDEHPTVLEGEWPETRTVLIAFPDRTAAMAWYSSTEYQALVRRRFASSRAEAVLVDGL